MRKETKTIKVPIIGIIKDKKIFLYKKKPKQLKLL